MDTLQKWALLKDIYGDEPQRDRVLDKLLEGTLSDYRQRRRGYQTALQAFEPRHEMDSAGFYPQFELGSLGDEMDFFEWAGLYELHQNLLSRIYRLELPHEPMSLEKVLTCVSKDSTER